MSFSDRLRQARKRQGLTQEELGKKSGLSTYTIQRYEYGKLNPKKDTVAKLATALNLGYDYTKSGEPYFYTFVDTVPSPEYEDAEDFNQEQYRNAIEKALEDVTSSTIGEKIKGIRKERGLTQKELAKQTGLSLDSIQGYEQNTTNNNSGSTNSDNSSSTGGSTQNSVQNTNTSTEGTYFPDKGTK